MNDLVEQFNYKYWVSDYNNRLNGICIDKGPNDPVIWYYSFEDDYIGNYN